MSDNIAPIDPELVPLLTFLKPYSEILSQDGVEEIMINGPGGMFVERAGKGINFIPDENSTYDDLIGLATLVASFSGQSINEVTTLLSSSLPNGERVQVVHPPSCEKGKVCFAIRKPSTANHTLDSLNKLGVFNEVASEVAQISKVDQELLLLKERREFTEFFTLAVESAKNIVISGGTSSGKTTLGNALLKCIPPHERIITIEDVREVQVAQKNRVHLLASKGGQGTSVAGIGELFGACLRLRPDRIMLSEVRGPEAYDFLNSVTSGHPGSITTVHADSVLLAVERLARYVGQHASGMNIPNREEYIRASCDIIVQVNKNTRTGWRGVTEILFNPTKEK